jgi:Rrf2 family protein
MRLSTKSTYGLRAMVDLALSYKRGSISISDIAAKEDISAAYLEQLLNKLRRNNLTKSLRGPNGGYVLARRPDTITVGDVVRVLEGDTAPVYCVKNEKDAKKLCDRTKTCVTRGVWKRLAHAIDAVLDSINLEELARQAECGGKYEKSVS